MKTTSAVITGPRKIEYIEEELPVLGPHDILIKTDSVGLCHTDLPVYQFRQAFGISEHGYRECQKLSGPTKLGHEPVGTVVETGREVTRFAVGDRVSGNYPQAFTTYRVVPDDTVLVKLPELRTDHRLCIAEPMGCVTNILHYMAQDKMDSVGVIGCGYMNLMVLSALRAQGVRDLVAVDLRDSRLELARRFGATCCLNSARQNIVDEVYELTNGRFLDSVVEMSGTLKGLDSACSIIKFAKKNGLPTGEYNGRGRIVITSVYASEEVFPMSLGYELVLRCPILDAAHPMCGVSVLQNDEEAVRAFADGSIPMDEMISHRFSFEELDKGFEMLENPTEDYIKGVVFF